MPSSLSRVAAVSFVSLVIASSSALAADVPIPGRVGIIKPAKLAKLVSKPAARTLVAK